MMKKLIALSVVLGVVVADPIGKNFSPLRSNVEVENYYVTDDAPNYDVAVKTDPTSLILNIFTKLIGYKSSALVIAVDIIDWLISNSIIIVFGAIATLGFCKLTDKCSLISKTYDELLPAFHFRNLVTPEHLETAEKFLTTAVEKYAQEKRGRAMKKHAWF